MLITDKYADKFYMVLACYDHNIFKWYIPEWSHAEGMTSYLYANNIRILDFFKFLPASYRVNPSKRQTYCFLRIALRSNISIDFMHSARMTTYKKIITNSGTTEELVHIFLSWKAILLTSSGMTKLQISTIYDHSGRKKWLAETPSPIVENKRSYRGLDFFQPNDLEVSRVIDQREFNHSLQLFFFHSANSIQLCLIPFSSETYISPEEE